MNHRRISDIIPYKIKVNKKGSNSNIYKTQNYIVNSNVNNYNRGKNYHVNTYIPSLQSIKSSKKLSNNNSVLTPYSNNFIINTKVIKCKNNSNSEEKIRKKNLNINIFDEKNHKNGNILEDLINNKYLKPILESQDIDEKLLNCNLKEPIKNSFNVSLNDFFNRKEKYFYNFKTPKIEMNKKGRGLSIKTHNLNNNNSINNINNVNSDITIHNKTLENNYYNDIKMANNYYNNNEINLLNFQSFNNNILHFSSEGKIIKDNSYTENNPLIYYSYERNNNLFKSKHNTYINNKTNNISNNINYLKEGNINNNNNNIVEYSQYNSPIGHYFKSQTYSQKLNNIDNYISYKPKKSTYNNKVMNIRNIGKGDIPVIGTKNYNIYENIDYKNNKYENIKNIIKENNNNIKQNKYDYNKKLFDIYRGKLINEFFRLMENTIKKYKNRTYRYFFDRFLKFKPINKIDEIFIPKIKLGKADKVKDNKKLIRISANLKKQKYSKIFYSEKKFPQKQNYLLNKNIINSLNLSQVNIDNKLYKKMNNSFMNNNEHQKDIISSNNLIIKDKKSLIPNRKNINTNIYIINRNSEKPSNNIIRNKSNKNNNIQIININNSLNQYIYKKKITISKAFVNKGNNNKKNTYNKDINKDDILSNSKGKIIDIDINLGKPIKEISDISPLENLFINDYNNKIFKTSLSTNKREKKKRKHKSKTKKLSLPKKKYLEEKYDIYPLRNENENDEDDKDDIFNIKNYSFDNNFNNIISLNNSYNLKHNNNYFQNFIDSNNDINNDIIINKKKNYKNILVKNIKTLDKRLFIHINYICSLSQENNNKNEKYETNLLKIERNTFFSIEINNKYPNKILSHNLIVDSSNSRNNNILNNENKEINKTNFSKNSKDKYLLSCVKFLIKNINRVFLNKAYRYFIKLIEEKYNKNNKNGNKKYKRNTYKKKISKSKI